MSKTIDFDKLVSFLKLQKTLKKLGINFPENVKTRYLKKYAKKYTSFKKVN